ncbi:hypothetical protein EJ05DRAFT_541812 [Pseudovirgaria hyperparasitica]|uniref:Mid2 domain-containing protein n=1 Tax=Pseudovirgaria hyperparasitica TaxID=470096 RepID=A0A6A6VTC2_9PEZI|nr:uncharacterized protein EJ05DRAFT_541812 [Pseudovirgaria hyperparasitica]KAF2753832.1 hypothetical protein EJ05DRAFT_541812 [Pseudovirgaria hyperparasitica]
MWYLIVSNLLLSHVAADIVNFIQPSSSSIWKLDSHETIEFTTALSDYTILLVQHNQQSNTTLSHPIATSGNVTTDGSMHTYPWTVQRYSFDLSVSPKFLIHVGADGDDIEDTSPRFTIAQADSTTSTDTPVSNLGVYVEATALSKSTRRKGPAPWKFGVGFGVLLAALVGLMCFCYPCWRKGVAEKKEVAIVGDDDKEKGLPGHEETVTVKGRRYSSESTSTHESYVVFGFLLTIHSFEYLAAWQLMTAGIWDE